MKNIMKLNDKEVAELIKASSLNNTDNYFAFGKMPSGNEIEKHAELFFEKTLVLTPGRPMHKAGEKVIYADIRDALHENFQEFLAFQGIAEIFLPFYECADVLEYGYKAAYASLAEIRASTEKPFHITGASPNVTDNEKIFSLLGSERFVQAGNKLHTDFRGIKTASGKSKFYYTAAECEKSPLATSIVMFSTRREAEEFSLFLYKRRTPFALIHGGMEKSGRKEALQRFLTGKVNILLATKFIIPAYTLISADKLIYCGLPYSLSHARRCLSLSKNGEMNCIFSEDDIILTEKLICSFAQALGIDDPAYIENRNKMFFDFLDQLQY